MGDPNQSTHQIHSRIGITSFTIAVIYAFFITCIKISNSYSFSMNEYTGLLTILLIGIGFGIMGALQRRRNHLFAYLGIIIHSAFLIVTIYEIFDRFYRGNG